MREAVVREQNECISDFRGGMTWPQLSKWTRRSEGGHRKWDGQTTESQVLNYVIYTDSHGTQELLVTSISLGFDILYTVDPWTMWELGELTFLPVENSYIIYGHSYLVPYPWIQPTTHNVCCGIYYWKKNSCTSRHSNFKSVLFKGQLYTFKGITFKIESSHLNSEIWRASTVV